MNADELDAAWRSLRTPDSAHQLEALPVTQNQVWAAVDHEGRRHLLLQVPEGTDAPPTMTRGLRVTLARHQVNGAEPAEYLDLACLSDDAAATFTAVAADIGADGAIASQDRRIAVVAAALSRWQWFWGVEAGNLSEQGALGLFAELWFLNRWAGDPSIAVDAWTAPTGSRHDFQWSDRSVEVKAAARRAGGAVLHHIQHLDQLSDPEEGHLFLFSLRVVRDQLAHNTLPYLVDRIVHSLSGDPRAEDEFARKLGQQGYNPAHRNRYEVPYRVLGEYIYSVGPGFPRLTVASFVNGPPAGITDVAYVLDMAVCDPWLRARTPEEWLT